MAIARGIGEVVTLGSAITLAHLVPPADFGRLAIAVIVTELAVSISAEGVQSPLIQRKTVTKAHYEAAALLALGLGVAFMFLTLVLATLVAAPLFGNEVADLFRLFSPAFLLAGLRAVPQAALHRSLNFKRISVIEIIAGFFAAGSSIAFAVGGFDAEAYVFGNLAGGVVSTILFLTLATRAWPRWRPAELREITRFGLPAGLSAISWVGYRNVDYSILGLVLSPAALGFYYRAYTIGVEYEHKISGIVQRIIFPVYSRTEGFEHMRDVRARIVRVNASIIFPLLAIFIATAPVLVPWVFGGRWEPAVLPAQILAVAGMAATVNAGTGPIVMAAGRPRVLLVLNTVQLFAYAATVVVAAQSGLTAVCLAVVAFQLVTIALSYRFVLQRLAGITLRQLAGDLAPAVVSSALLLALAAPLNSFLDGAGTPAPVAVALTTFAAAPVYLIAMRRLFPSAWSDLELLFGGVLRRRRARAGAPSPAVT